MAEEEKAHVQLDESLMWENYIESANKVPSQVLYQEIAADSVSDSGFSFNFRAPADNALLDNDLVIAYTLELTKSDLQDAVIENFSMVAGAPPAPDDTTTLQYGTEFVPRQCFPVARCLQNLSVTINGSNFNVQPVYWLDALNRLYFSEEEARTLCSGSGGAFDSRQPAPISKKIADAELVSIGATTGTYPNAGITTYVIPDGYTSGDLVTFKRYCNDPDAVNGYNGGFESRKQSWWMRVFDANKSTYNTLPVFTATDGTNALYTGTWKSDIVKGIANDQAPGNSYGVGTTKVSVTVYEKLPIAPFCFHPSKDPKMSIPNIRQININAQFIANKLTENMFQGYANGWLNYLGAKTATGLNVYSVSVTGATIYAKWRLTDMALPPIIRLPTIRYKQYLKTVTTTANTMAAAGSPYDPTSYNFTYSNIQLDSIPDKFFIFVAIRPDKYECLMPSETNLAIDEIRLTIGGASGRLTTLNSFQMYENFLKLSAHGGESKLDYRTWYNYRCVAVIEPSDIGLQAGAGYNYKTNLTVDLTCKNKWIIAENLQRLYPLGVAALECNFVVLCEYAHNYLELNSSGGSRSGMTMIPRM
jgi:hypothetical protein